MSDELRDLVREELYVSLCARVSGTDGDVAALTLGILTSLPTVAALLADAERVQRVRELADAWEGRGESTWQEFRRALTKDYDGYLYAKALRRALDGDR